MTEQAIADALVEAEILTLYQGMYTPGGIGLGMRASSAINDWHTAGACLKRMKSTEIVRAITDHGADWLKDPRAICEEFVTEVLKGQNGDS